VRALCAQFPGEYFRKIDEARDYPEEFVTALTKAGWLAALIPQEYGGSGLSLTEASIIMEEINRSGGNSGACHGQMYNMGTLLRYLDFGGGLGIAYDGETPPAPTEYAQVLIEASRGLKMTLILEPGRVIVGPAGALISRVVRRKKQGDKQFVVVDAGMNDLIRPPLYGSFHRILPARQRGGEELIDLVGPICESSDFLARDRRVERLEGGDLVAVMTAGAYGSALASNYNSRPRPAEVLVDGDSFTTIRRRETYEDLIRLEK
jgi:diaminopimelate decarboxylase